MSLIAAVLRLIFGASYAGADAVCGQPVNIWKVRWLIPTWASGLTIGKDVFIRSTLKGQAQRNVIKHELVHVAQYIRLGWKFPLLYIYYHFKYGYWNNPFEVEARTLKPKCGD